MTAAAWAIAFYLLVQFGIGIWASKRIATEDDYLVAGRKLGYPLATFSIFATWFGAETCIGAAGDIYANGLSWTSAEPFGYGLCIILMGLVFAVPLWRRKLTTLADLFRDRYSVSVERVAAVFLIPTSLFWAAAQVRAFGYVLSTVSTVNVGIAITIAALLVVLYTAFGGLLADAVTDVIQGVTLVLGLLLLFAATIAALGGPAEAWTTLVSVGAETQARRPEVSMLEALEAWAIPVLGSVAATELISRVIAARSPQVAQRSAFAAGGLYISIGLIPVFIGLTGAALIPDLAQSEALLPAVAQALLPGVLYVMFAGALISAILSTADSTLLVASGLLSHNLVVPFTPGVSERAKVLIARLGVAGFGVIAYMLALRATGVLDLVEQASAFGSSGTLVIVCFGLFTGFGGPMAALATLVAGMGSYLLGVAIGSPIPFITSLVAALVTYLMVGLLEGALVRSRAPDLGSRA